MTEPDASDRTVTACLIVIGDEILSGRTQDANLAYLARWLNGLGVRLDEARVIPDVHERIVDAVRECRAGFDYVFTTGGIGPTHDDITAEAVAAAFDVALKAHPDAYEALLGYYGEARFTEARQRMARAPAGADLIDNPISIAPGYHIGNVFVLAGIPAVMQAMLESVRHKLVGGKPVLSKSLTIPLAESALAGELADIAAANPETQIGSYPFYGAGRGGVIVVVRSVDMAAIDTAILAISAAADRHGAHAEAGD